MNEFNRTRAKILGVLIRDARLHAGRTPEDCARILGISAAKFKKAEEGEEVFSLPDLEALAIYLDVPLTHFWGEKTLGDYRQTEFGEFAAARHKAIGERLTAAREAAQRTVQEVAQEVEVSPKRIREYEAGETPVPLLDLDRIARYLGYSLNYFMDESEDGPLRAHENRQKIQQRFKSLPPEMQAFVTEPINVSYLEIALRLSKMDVKSLRTVAENILNITF